MLPEYASPRDHLDDVIALVERMVRRLELATQAGADPRAIAEAHLEIARHEELIAARCEATAYREPLPLERLCVACGLSPTEARAIAVLAALEVAPGARRTAAKLIPERDASVTVELVEMLVYRSFRSREAAVEELAGDGSLFTYRLVELGNDSLPWLARPLRLAPRVLELAMGRLRLDVEVAQVATLVEEPPSGEALVVSAACLQLVEEAIEQQRGGAGPVPLIIGPAGAGRASLALGVARSRELAALEIRASDLPRNPAELVRALAAIEREALLFDALLLIRDLEALETSTERTEPDLISIVARSLAGYRGRVAVTATRNVWPPRGRRPIVLVEIAPPTETERTTIWERFVADRKLACESAARYRITGGVIARVANTARALASTRHAEIELPDIRAGIRGQLDADLSTLGRRVEWHQSWNDLVLPVDVVDELAEMMSRIVNRQRVLDDWGFASKVGRGMGVSALFSGAPGTGKTMVAGLIANELSLDLYQIDVARMVSKWVGETEKNLARLFDAADAGHAVLLFDEADSLFAKRTEVKSSNDRYANLEVNYLLQRMEAFEGITILTTNLESSIDEAFRRRLAFRINFPVPDFAERTLLWQAMLPARADVATGIDFADLARRFEMSGGYIRNAVLRAAFLAAADDSAIQMRHLQRAAELEATAMGKIVHHGGLR